MNRVSAPGAPSIDRLQVQVQTPSITPSKCISTHARSQSGSASLSSLDHSLQVYFQLARSHPPSESPKSLDYALQVRTIAGSKCITKLAWSTPPSASPNSHDHGLGVYLGVHLIAIFRHTSNCSQALPAGSLDIPCVDGSPCRYIDGNTTWIHEF